MATESAFAELVDLIVKDPSLCNPEEKLSLWGVSLDKDALSSSKPAQKILTKFLVARNFISSDAFNMLKDTIQWRRSFGVDGILDEQFPPQMNELGCLYKTDKQGRPVTYNFYIGLTADLLQGGGLDQFVRWRVQLMEKGIRELDFSSDERDQMFQIHNYDGVGFFSMSKEVRAASKQIISLFQNYYPELMRTKVFANVPFYMQYLFSFMSNFVSERTLSKFMVTSSGNTISTLVQYIKPENLHPALLKLPSVDSVDSAPVNAVEIQPSSKHQLSFECTENQRLAISLSCLNNDTVGLLVQLALSGTTEDLVAQHETGSYGGVVPLKGTGSVLIRIENSSAKYPKTIVFRTKLLEKEP